MKALKVAILLLPTFTIVGAESPYSEADWLQQGIARQIAKFQRTTFTPHPEQTSILAANCERDRSWSGQLCVFHHTADRIDWIAAEPASYAKQRGDYVLSCDWRRLEKLKMWVLEVFDSTHMGNGSLWLFALEGKTLRVLLHTTARGSFLEAPPELVVPPLGETRLVESHLAVAYPVPDGSTTETVVLTGTIAAMDQEGRQQSTKSHVETWTWDANKRVFTRVPR